MKAKIRKTGEIVEIISYCGSTARSEVLDSVSYIDSNGVEHDRESFNFYWDFERLEEKTDNTDWNQVRIQAAIVAMQGIISNAHQTDYRHGTYCEYKDGCSDIAKQSVWYADALIKELKRKEDESK